MGHHPRMGADFGAEIHIAVPAATAWELVGDPCGVPRWYPLYLRCTVEDGIRTLERADGAQAQLAAFHRSGCLIIR